MRALVLLGILALAALATAGPTPATEVERALEWLASLPPDGGDGRGYATNVVEALGAAGIDPKRWPSADASEFARLAPYAGPDGPYYSHLRVAHAAGAAGYDPRAVNGADYVALVRAGFTGGQSGSATFVNDDVWAILALRAAGVAPSDEQIRASVLTLRAAQLPDGGWAYRLPALKGSTDVTGAALAALRAAGEPMADFANARTFLDNSYVASSGGHHANDGGGANCQSTVWALHGYAALGAPERSASLEYLRGLQHPSGGFATSRGTDGTLAPANAFCTAEAVVALAGARYPLPSYAPLTPPRPVGHAREPVALAIGAPFSRAVWEVDGARLEGTRVQHVFAATGTYTYHLLAEGSGFRARTTGEVVIHSARPQLGSFPAHVTLARHAPLTLDLTNATDPDGRIVRFEVDWGDGSWSNGTDRRPSHAYAAPGARTIAIAAVDDEGVMSAPATIRVDVLNAAPVLAPLPARLLGDRVSGVTLHVNATDPDGDALDGTGARTIRPATLGEHAITIVVRDPYGAEARANVTVEIVNLPPLVRIVPPPDPVEGEEIALRAEVSDPDGQAPTLHWLVDGAPVESPLRLGAGPHTLVARATDADGEVAQTTATIVVRAPDAPPSAAPSARPPAIRSLDATLSDGMLRVGFDADGRATLRWRSDAGEGERVGAESPSAIPLAGASWATVELVAERDGLAASRATGLLVPPAAPAPPAPPRETPQALTLHAAPEPAPAPPAPEPAPDTPLIPQGAATRETPAPLWLATAALALAAMRRTRAR